MSIEYLGLDFYKDYQGLKSPLSVRIREGSMYEFHNGNMDHRREWDFKYISCADCLMIGEGGLFLLGYGDVKPILIHPNDLTDKQWLFVFGDMFYLQSPMRIKKFEKLRIERAVTDNYTDTIFIKQNTITVGKFMPEFGIFEMSYGCNYQAIIKRLNSLHSNIYAHKYIKDGLALDIKFSD